MSYLVDTNVISELVRAKPNNNVIDWVEAIPADSLHISVLTLGEIRKGIENIKERTKKEKLRIFLEHELPQWFGDRVLDIDQHVADCWGRIQAQVNRPLPAIDSLIAATAIHFNLSIVTRNISDFTFVNLEVINPWDFKA